jgi:DNA-binding GntR family transcriptional regulator
MALDLRLPGGSEAETATLREQVIASLKEAFFAGVLKPGDTIVERQLARDLNIGTPAIREALVTLHEQGFVRRVANTATYVNQFSADEVRQLYELRIEFETLALRWAKLRAGAADLECLEETIGKMTEAARNREARAFYEFDLQFHRACWRLSGNLFLERSLENLVPPLFAFVLNASEITVAPAVAQQHRALVNALRDMQEPEFSSTVRQTLSSFALSGMASMAARFRV